MYELALPPQAVDPCNPSVTDTMELTSGHSTRVTGFSRTIRWIDLDNGLFFFWLLLALTLRVAGLQLCGHHQERSTLPVRQAQQLPPHVRSASIAADAHLVLLRRFGCDFWFKQAGAM